MEIHAQPPLAGRHAVVTGGGRGIGAVVADALARAGAAVSLIGRNAEKLCATATRIANDHGVKTAAATADVSDEAAVCKAIGKVRDSLGTPAILVNNAGVGISLPFLKSDRAFWRQLLDTDLMGAVYCTQAILPGMLRSKWGRIVNIASTAGLTGYAYISAYCAAKHGMIGFTRALAIEIARTGVTVNAICPSYVDTEMTAETVANIVQKTGRTEDEALASLVAHNPQGRLIQPFEIADTVVWLCGENAASVTGQSIVIAGGELMP